MKEDQNEQFRKDMLATVNQIAEKFESLKKETQEAIEKFSEENTLLKEEGICVLNILIFDEAIPHTEQHKRSQAMAKELKPLLKKYGVLGINALMVK
jgi:hypothetical protein